MFSTTHLFTRIKSQGYKIQKNIDEEVNIVKKCLSINDLKNEWIENETIVWSINNLI